MKNAANRIRKLEAALPHEAIISQWLRDLNGFESPEEYLAWAFQDWSRRAPIPKLLSASGSFPKRRATKVERNFGRSLRTN